MKTLGFLPRGYGFNHSPHSGPCYCIPCGVVDVLHGNVAIVLDVLHLLSVSMRFLKSLDYEGGCRWTDRNLEQR